MYYVVDLPSLEEFNLYLKEDNLHIVNKQKVGSDTLVELNNGDKFTFTIPLEKEDSKDLIWGKDSTTRIVGVETLEDKLVVYRELEDGTIERQDRPLNLWLLAPKQYNKGFIPLEGKQHYKYIKMYNNLDTFKVARKASWNFDTFSVGNPTEANLIYSGTTFFKDMRMEDVSILSWDIETDGIRHTSKSEVYMISNTFRKKGITTRKLFIQRPAFHEELNHAEYTDFVFCDDQRDLLNKWTEWVTEIDPSIVIGHNIYGYDLPYIQHCANLCDTELPLGRDGSNLRFNDRESRFRKDGSQFYHYKKAFMFGRQIIDTMFLSIKHDIGRQYESYRLKAIIAHEELEAEDRQHYDAGKIRNNIHIKEEWLKITKYAIFDSDDSLKLFDLMMPPFFYLTPHIPMVFEDMINRASGSQINTFMIRAYLQEGHSIPAATEVVPFEGAISIGNPGIYKDVWKVDVASLYPSIMRQWKVSSKEKDPKGYFIRMVDYFTLERLANKKRAKDTGDKYYTNTEQAQKIVINSAYGFLGTPGLNFNAPDLAAFITEKARDILRTSIIWATGYDVKKVKIKESTEKSKEKFEWTKGDKKGEGLGYDLVNADTDSISITRHSHISTQDRVTLLEKLNLEYPELIKWEDDGYYTSFVVVKAKNYITVREDGKVKVKGSGLVAPNKEPALKELNSRYLKSLAGLSEEDPFEIYMEYVKEACHITDITRWASKKTITEKVINGTRPNETKILEALEGTDFSEGDKVYTFFRKDGSIALREHFDGDYDMSVMHKKLFNSINTFELVLDMSKFINYSLKRNRALLEEIINKGT